MIHPGWPANYGYREGNGYRHPTRKMPTEAVRESYMARIPLRLKIRGGRRNGMRDRTRHGPEQPGLSGVRYSLHRL